MKWKFHAIAISAIIAIVVIMFAMTGQLDNAQAQPAQMAQQQTAVEDGKYIQISRATWGKNCNGFITMYNRQQEQLATAKKEKAQPYSQVSTNNVLLPVSTICNGKDTCEVQVSADTFAGRDPMPKCQKKLEVEYRCFSYDRAQRVEALDHNNLKIDCSGNAMAARNTGETTRATN